MSNSFQLDALISQFTWIPSPKQIGTIPEMRWLYALTAFPEITVVGDFSLIRLKSGNRFGENYFLIKATIMSEDYISAKEILFQKIQQALDILSLVSSRGFKIFKITPSKSVPIKRKQTFEERMRAYILEKIKTEPIPIATAITNQAGEATLNIQAYEQYFAELKLDGYLGEYLTFTHDAIMNQDSKINLSSMKIEDLKSRLSLANANYSTIATFGKLTSAIRLYRTSLQLNDYLARFVVLWTALESASELPRNCEGTAKIRFIANKIIELPGIKTLEKATDTLEKLNSTRNKIIHRMELTTQIEFQELLSDSLPKLDWVVANFLLLKLNLKLLHENSSPL